MNALAMGMLKMVVDELLDAVLTEENKQKYGDWLFDLVEEAIKDSETTLDDKLLPVIQRIRELAGIPDQPDESESK